MSKWKRFLIKKSLFLGKLETTPVVVWVERRLCKEYRKNDTLNLENEATVVTSIFSYYKYQKIHFFCSIDWAVRGSKKRKTSTLSLAEKKGKMVKGIETLCKMSQPTTICKPCIYRVANKLPVIRLLHNKRSFSQPKPSFRVPFWLRTSWLIIIMGIALCCCALIPLKLSLPGSWRI